MYFIQEFWNNTLRGEQKPAKARDYIRASEIGMPMADRFLSMKGVEPTNGFSDRTLRIFDAGRVIEWMVLRSLALAGILNRRQGWLELPETDKHLRVVGKLDATIGGITNWDEAQERVREYLNEYKLDLDDDVLEEKATSIILGLREQYPAGWPEEMMVEVKSINSMAFFAHKNRDAMGRFKGYDHNKLQLYAYLEMAKLRQGILLYVSKDDFTVAEVPVSISDEALRETFYRDIETISWCYRADSLPMTEPPIIYNDRKGKFETNWGVGRSPYLQHLYGYKDSEAYERENHQYLLDLNRALKHLREGKVKVEDLPLIAEWNMNEMI
jgi:hypothetical protein